MIVQISQLTEREAVFSIAPQRIAYARVGMPIKIWLQEKPFPIGIDVILVSDQPQVVKQAIGGFTEALFEAIGIVLLVSFVSLDLRAGLVVALSIPLVLSIRWPSQSSAAWPAQRC